MSNKKSAKILCELGSSNLPRDQYRIDFSQMSSKGEPIKAAPKIDIWVYTTKRVNQENSHPDAIITLLTVTKDDEDPVYIVRGEGFQAHRDYSSVSPPTGFDSQDSSSPDQAYTNQFDDLGEAVKNLTALAQEFETNTTATNTPVA